MAGQINVIYGTFEQWATKISSKNRDLLNDLHEIQRLVNSLEGDYESNAAVAIRGKITGMENRFQQYYDVVDNYVKIIRNAGAGFANVERTNTANAEQFI